MFVPVDRAEEIASSPPAPLFDLDPQSTESAPETVATNLTLPAEPSALGKEDTSTETHSAAFDLPAWSYGHDHPVIRAGLPAVTILRRPSTLSGPFCRPVSVTFLDKRTLSLPETTYELLEVPETTEMQADGTEPSVLSQDEHKQLSSGNVDPGPFEAEGDSQTTPTNPSYEDLLHDRIRLESQLRDLNEAVAFSFQGKSDLQSRVAHLESRNHSFTSSLDSLTSSRDDALRELSNVKQRSRGTELRVQQLEWELQGRTRELGAKDARLRAVEGNLEETRRKLTEVEVERDENDGVIVALKNKISSAQVELEQCKQEKSRLLTDRLPNTANLGALTIERNFLSDQLSKCKASQNQLKEDLQKSVDDRLEDRLQFESLRREKTSLEQKIMDLQHIAMKEKTNFLKQLERVESEQRKRETELLKKSASIHEGSKSGSGKFISEPEWARLSELVGKVDVLELELASSKKDAQALRDSLVAVESDRKDFAKRVVIAEKSVEERDATIEFLNRRLQAAASRLVEFTEQQSNFDEETKKTKLLAVDLNELQRERDALLQKNSALESSLVQSRTETDHLRQEKSTIQANLQRAKTEQASVTAKLALVQQELQSKSFSLLQITSEQNALGKHLKMLQTQLNAAESQNALTGNLEQELKVSREQEAIWKLHAIGWQEYSQKLSARPTATDLSVQTEDLVDPEALRKDEMIASLSEEVRENTAEVDRLSVILGQVEDKEKRNVLLEKENVELKGKTGLLDAATEQLQNYVRSVDEKSAEILYQLENEKTAHQNLRTEMDVISDAYRSLRAEYQYAVLRLPKLVEHSATDYSHGEIQIGPFLPVSNPEVLRPDDPIVATLQNQISELENQKRADDDRMQRLTKFATDVQEKYSNLEQELHDTRHRLIILERENSILVGNSEKDREPAKVQADQDDTKNTPKSPKIDLKQRIAEKRRREAERQKQVEELAEVSALQEKCRNLENSLDALSQKEEVWRSQKEASDKDYSSLIDQYQQLQHNSMTQAMGEISNLQKKCGRLERSLEELLQRDEAWESQRESLEQAYKALMDQYENLQQKSVAQAQISQEEQENLCLRLEQTLAAAAQRENEWKLFADQQHQEITDLKSQLDSQAEASDRAYRLLVSQYEDLQQKFLIQSENREENAEAQASYSDDVDDSETLIERCKRLEIELQNEQENHRQRIDEISHAASHREEEWKFFVGQQKDRFAQELANHLENPKILMEIQRAQEPGSTPSEDLTSQLETAVVRGQRLETDLRNEQENHRVRLDEVSQIAAQREEEWKSFVDQQKDQSAKEINELKNQLGNQKTHVEEPGSTPTQELRNQLEGALERCQRLESDLQNQQENHRLRLDELSHTALSRDAEWKVFVDQQKEEFTRELSELKNQLEHWRTQARFQSSREPGSTSATKETSQMESPRTEAEVQTSGDSGSTPTRDFDQESVKSDTSGTLEPSSPKIKIDLKQRLAKVRGKKDSEELKRRFSELEIQLQGTRLQMEDFQQGNDLLRNENSALQSQIEALQNELESQRTRNRQLETEVAENLLGYGQLESIQQENHVLLRTQIEALKCQQARCQELEAQVYQYEQQMLEVTQTVERTDAEWRKYCEDQQSVADRKIAEFQRRIDVLSSELAGLQQALQEESQSKTQLEAQYSQLVEDSARSAELQPYQPEQISQLIQRNLELEHQKSELENLQSAQSLTESDSLLQKYRSLEESLASERETHRLTTLKLAEYENERSGFITMIEDLRARIANSASSEPTCSQELAEAQTKIQNLERAIETEREKHSSEWTEAAAHHAAEWEKFGVDQKAGFDQEFATLFALNQELNSVNLRLIQRQAELENQVQYDLSTSQKILELETLLETERRTHETQWIEAATQHASEWEAVGAAQKVAADAEFAALLANQEDLKREKAEVTEENLRLVVEIDGLKMLQRAKEQLEEQNSYLVQQNGELNQQLANLLAGASYGEMDSADELNAANQKIHELELQLESERAAHQALLINHASEWEDFATAQKAASDSAYAILLAIHEDLKSQNAHLVDQNLNLAKRIEELSQIQPAIPIENQEVLRSDDRIQQLENLLTETVSQWETFAAEQKATFEAEYGKLSESLEQLKTENSYLVQQNGDLGKQIAEAAENQGLSEYIQKIQDLENQLIIQEGTHKTDWEKAVSQHTSEWETFVVQQKSAFDAENGKHLESIEELKAQNSYLTQQNSELGKQAADSGNSQELWEKSREFMERVQSLEKQLAQQEESHKAEWEKAVAEHSVEWEIFAAEQKSASDAEYSNLLSLYENLGKSHETVQQEKSQLESRSVESEHIRLAYEQAERRTVDLVAEVELLKNGNSPDYLKPERYRYAEAEKRIETLLSKTEMESLKMWHSAVRTENGGLQLDLGECRVALENAEQRIADLLAERGNKADDDMQERYQNVVADYEEKLAEINGAMLKHDEEWKSFAESQEIAAEEEKKRLTGVISQLEIQLEDARKASKALDNTGEIAALRQQLEFLQAQLSEEKDQFDQERQATSEAITAHDKEWEEYVDQEKASMEEQNSQLILEIDQLRSELTEVQKTVQDRPESDALVKEQHSSHLDVSADNRLRYQESVEEGFFVNQEPPPLLQDWSDQFGGSSAVFDDVIANIAQQAVASLYHPTDQNAEETAVALADEADAEQRGRSSEMEKLRSEHEESMKVLQAEWEQYYTSQITPLAEENSHLRGEVGRLTSELELWKAQQSQAGTGDGLQYQAECIQQHGTAYHVELPLTNIVRTTASSGMQTEGPPLYPPDSAHCSACDQMQAQLEITQSQIISLHEQIQVLQNGNPVHSFAATFVEPSTNDDVRDLQTRLDSLRTENDELRMMLDDFRDTYSDQNTRSVQDDSDEIAGLKEDRMRLQVELLALQEELEDLRSDDPKSSSEPKRVSFATETGKKDSIAQTEERLDERPVGAKESLEKWMVYAGQLRTAHDHLTEDNERSRDEIVRLNQEIATLQILLESAVAGSSRRGSDAGMSFDAAAEETLDQQSLHFPYAARRGSVQKNWTSSEAWSQTHPEEPYLYRSNSAAAAATKCMQQLQDELSTATDQHDSDKAEIKQMINQRESVCSFLESEIDDLSPESKQVVGVVNQSIAGVEVEMLRREAEEATGRSEALENVQANLVQHVTSLQNQLAEKDSLILTLEQRITDSQEQLRKFRASVELEKLGLIAQMEVSDSRTRQAMEESNGKAIEIVELQAQVENGEEERQELRGLLKQTRKKLEETELELERALKQLEKVKRKLAEKDEAEKALRDGVGAAELERDALATQIGNLQAEIKLLSAEVERKQALHDAFRERVSHEASILDEEIQGLRDHLQMRETEFRDLESLFVSTRQENIDLTSRLKTERRKNRNNSRSHNSESDRSHVSSNGDAFNRSYQKLLGVVEGSESPRTNSTLKSCMSSLKSEIDDLKAQMDLHVKVLKSKSEIPE